MLTLRGWAILLVAGVLLGPAAAAQPDHVTYVLGGVMSGPFRLDGDLATGAFSEAQPPPGQFGDRAGLDANAMPVTRSWTVPPQKLAVLRRLAARVWRHGMENRGTSTTRRGADGIPVITLIPCHRTIDALGGLALEQGGQKRSFDFSMTCLSKDGEAFLHTLLTTK